MLIRNVVACVFFGLIFTAVACKNDKGTGAAGSASVTSALSGSCKFVIDKPQCQPGGKAAFCSMASGATKWQPFSCPDCAASDKGVKCSAFTVGEPCDMLATTSAMCSADGKSEYSCDFDTHVWKTQPCPGGCKGDMEKGLTCE